MQKVADFTDAVGRSQTQPSVELVRVGRSLGHASPTSVGQSVDWSVDRSVSRLVGQQNFFLYNPRFSLEIKSFFNAGLSSDPRDMIPQVTNKVAHNMTCEKTEISVRRR